MSKPEPSPFLGAHPEFGPIILCRPAGKLRWVFTCPWCGAVHGHGSGQGPRTSHCRHPDAPRGYYLVAAR